ncbi:hypothetical protein CHS0354_041921 [Potamilus streckersoni]|uniref:Signal peptidase complex subunit 3 n=1 Tax=Potamilus streckersoni TaxID=2493646 RepID=A0AAE0SSW8_9BIVA|nr:hypothetical protein CHS0354_041921 [Potamilus streckersoni]
MNTFLSRLNTIFAFTLSVMAGLTFLCFLSTFFNDHKTLVSINTGKIIVKSVPDYSTSREKNDLGFVVFDVQSDILSSLIVPTTSLFLYLTAEYTTQNHKLNQIVMWDKIIKRGENAIIDYKSMNTKYYFWDYGNGLRGNRNVTMTLSWNVIPNAGTLPKVMGEGSHRFAFPDDYTYFDVNHLEFLTLNSFPDHHDLIQNGDRNVNSHCLRKVHLTTKMSPNCYRCLLSSDLQAYRYNSMRGWGGPETQEPTPPSTPHNLSTPHPNLTLGV